ncbi:MAG: endonuclease/exonuclease/phosphatase family protein [Bacteroidales bacterium]
MTLRKTTISLMVISLLIFQGGCRKTPEPPAPGNSIDFSNCITAGTGSSLEILTINLHGFPKDGYQSVVAVSKLISQADADIVAIQEVATEAGFNQLLDELDGWDGRFYPELNDVYNLAFVFKTSEISIDDSKTKLILTNDSYAFPRAPFEVYLKHRSLNIGTYLINVHLKCCGGSDNEARRQDAALKLDSYINANHKNDPVIVLGDYNDEISGTSASTNVFYNFIANPSDYRFADMAIAKGSQLWWSYPSYPSHIDHMLVTNELFGKIDTTVVLKPDPCYAEYFTEVSDHRPVKLVLR